MKWHEITVHTTAEAVEMASNFLHELGAGGVTIEEWEPPDKPRDTSLGQWYELLPSSVPEGRAVLQGYYVEGTDLEEVLAELKRRMAELADYGIDTGNPEYAVRLVDEQDWANAWKQYFKPLRVTERLTIKPTWEPYDASPNEIVLELDPGMAFGTGTHATTSLCLKALEQVIRPSDDVIDVGTGSGVLAIAAAKLGARHVLALDLDPVAVSSATENVRLNGLEEAITVRHSDLLQALKDSGSGESVGVRMPVQVVVANILAEIILLFIDDVAQVLPSGGRYIVSGIITAKEQIIEEALSAAGFGIESKDSDQDWVVFVARKK
ncbi:50S ribosomal protein L11 methyltransferase [Gordoniibacillus kamchatkensis]|uniref:Ribosomal protein L11 methyltransferase n=1 Tax=Gordoniibacillus kamchatkensis TaxID=1590651 RepID=A0ABR5ACG2_9BACL|nr:50S ribosomal protein L11 methyltransferase [Paenibacillus sp. VKM B-2647]KIL38290.1 50S ribosomal protein L11 methyltransferase [Paenibacillus sp. VKM B-2647]